MATTTSGGRMPLLEHLREFRKRIVRSAIAILIFSGIGWAFYNQIINTLAKPVCDLEAAKASSASHCGSLYINGVLGPLNLHIKIISVQDCVLDFLGKVLPWRLE